MAWDHRSSRDDSTLQPTLSGMREGPVPRLGASTDPTRDLNAWFDEMRSDLIFWDVDTQVDFKKADGRLYVPDSESIIPVVARLTDYAHAHRIRIIASSDDHVPGHRELSTTPDWKETFPDH